MTFMHKKCAHEYNIMIACIDFLISVGNNYEVCHSAIVFKKNQCGLSDHNVVETKQIQILSLSVYRYPK